MKAAPTRYIGIMSGTSVDAIDAVLVSFDESRCELIEAYSEPFDDETRREILALFAPGEDEISRLGYLHVKLGKQYAGVANTLLQRARLNPDAVAAIGCHGQTVRHCPPPPKHAQPGFSVQIGDGSVIAAETGIVCINDFRSKDLALGGQGAPIAPAFHAFLSQGREACGFLNLGGIANLSVLTDSVLGYDIGPANALLDAWYGRHHPQGQLFDRGGAWAGSGNVIPELLERCLSEPFFSQPPPKSTGKELFNLSWLETHLRALSPYAARDIQATLSEVSARTISNAIDQHPALKEVFVCGGGLYNSDLMRRLHRLKPGLQWSSSASLGLAPEWVEAAAFAWLAMMRLEQKAVDLAGVTGAKRNGVLGAVHWP